MMTKEDYRILAVQLRCYANLHERPPYGMAIEGEEDLERQAADAIDDLLELAERRANIVRVETPLGALIARDSGFGPQNPGISILLRREDADFDLLLDLVECTDEFNGEGMQVATRVYPNAMKEEPCDAILHQNIEEYFKLEEVEG